MFVVPALAGCLKAERRARNGLPEGRTMSMVNFCAVEVEAVLATVLVEAGSARKSRRPACQIAASEKLACS